MNSVKELFSFLINGDFALAPSLWDKLSDVEKQLVREELVQKCKPEEIIEIYEDFCFINKNLSKEILGPLVSLANLEKKLDDIDEIYKNYDPSDNDLKEGKKINSWEEYIDFKVNYLKAFRQKLEAEEFNPELISILLDQELAHLNELSLGGDEDDRT